MVRKATPTRPALTATSMYSVVRAAEADALEEDLPGREVAAARERMFLQDVERFAPQPGARVQLFEVLRALTSRGERRQQRPRAHEHHRHRNGAEHHEVAAPAPRGGYPDDGHHTDGGGDDRPAGLREQEGDAVGGEEEWIGLRGEPAGQVRILDPRREADHGQREERSRDHRVTVEPQESTAQLLLRGPGVDEADGESECDQRQVGVHDQVPGPCFGPAGDGRDEAHGAQQLDAARQPEVATGRPDPGEGERQTQGPGGRHGGTGQRAPGWPRHGEEQVAGDAEVDEQLDDDRQVDRAREGGAGGPSSELEVAGKDERGHASGGPQCHPSWPGGPRCQPA